MRLALYAHYSDHEGVALYVFYYLQKLHEMGFEVCFISNSPIPPEKKRELEAICERVIERENTGFDFGMWKQAIALYDLGRIDELLLTNSSIIGPLQPLEPLWNTSTARHSDFWGLTDNDEFGLHLQTYFLVFRSPILTHSCFREFWDSVENNYDRQATIERYEIGLTRQMSSCGFKWAAVFPRRTIRWAHLRRQPVSEIFQYALRRSSLPKNTTMLLPDLLLEWGMPFLKTKLLASGGNTHQQVNADFVIRLLESSNLPKDILNEFKASLKA